MFRSFSENLNEWKGSKVWPNQSREKAVMNL